jgi:hypothetical protein
LVDLGIGYEQRLVGKGQIRQIRTVGDVHVCDHLLIEGKHGGRRAQLGAHVTDGALAGGTDRFRSGSEVFDNLVRAALDGE